MIAVAVLMMSVCYWRRPKNETKPDTLARHFARFGANLRSLTMAFYPACICLVVLLLAGAVLLALGIPISLVQGPWPTTFAVALMMSFVAIVTLWVLSRKRSQEWESRISGSMLFLLVAALAASPIIWAQWQRRSMAGELLTVLWLLVGTGLGEELFFRGYVQSRLNLAFGRRWTLFGVSYGPGLLWAAALFGMIHVLNSYDYFKDLGSLSWRHGLTTMFALHYGFLRERTGTVVAPLIVHFLVNLGPRLPMLINGGFSSG